MPLIADRTVMDGENPAAKIRKVRSITVSLTVQGTKRTPELRPTVGRAKSKSRPLRRSRTPMTVTVTVTVT